MVRVTQKNRRTKTLSMFFLTFIFFFVSVCFRLLVETDCVIWLSHSICKLWKREREIIKIWLNRSLSDHFGVFCYLVFSDKNDCFRSCRHISLLLFSFLLSSSFFRSQMGHSQSYDLRNPETGEKTPVRGVRRVSREHQTDGQLVRVLTSKML